MTPDYLRSIPAKNTTGFFPVQVKKVGFRELFTWDRYIQPAIRKMPDRLDKRWIWSLLYRVCKTIEAANGRDVSVYQLQRRSASGIAVPVGQVLLSEGFPALDNPNLPSVFLWYLCGTPGSVQAAYGLEPAERPIPYLVDIAIQRSYELGYEGRIGLHAAPQPGGLIELFKLYREMSRLRNLDPALIVERFMMKRNDGRYFYANEKLAQSLTISLDYLRRR